MVGGPGLALGHPISFDFIVSVSSNANECESEQYNLLPLSGARGGVLSRRGGSPFDGLRTMRTAPTKEATRGFKTGSADRLFCGLFLSDRASPPQQTGMNRKPVRTV